MSPSTRSMKKHAKPAAADIAQRPGAGATHGYLRIRMVGLCYDTPPVEALPCPIAMPDTPPRALSEDFSQEKLPSQPLVERLRRNICLLEACIREKSPLKPLFGFHLR